MSKILKLINNERKSLSVRTQKASGCDHADSSECALIDTSTCSYGMDYCTYKDYAACSGGSVDHCQELDNSGCMEKHYDSCIIDTTFCSESAKYDFETE